MSRMLLPLSAAAALMGGTALADVPRVAVDIAPVHSLVARVMDGVGVPGLIIPPEASPHEYNLRPSEAARLQDADLVFWIGEGLTPWMGEAVRTLAEDAVVTALLNVEGTRVLPFREGALFEAHDHGHGDEKHGHDDHAHDDHDHDHAKAEKAEYDDHGPDDHAHDDHGHDDHAHGDHDPHAWLSPENAVAWLTVIASRLSAADPENAGAYFANAAAAAGELTELTAEIDAMLAPFRGRNFIVFHDAYQYFETSFDIPASGAISLSDAADPSPARIAGIQARIRDAGVACVLAEPQFNEGLVAAVLDGTEASTGVIDPIGATLEPGPELYPQMMRNMAATLAGCL